MEPVVFEPERNEGALAIEQQQLSPEQDRPPVLELENVGLRFLFSPPKLVR